MKYFILNQNENGLSVSGPFSKQEVLKSLEENYFGNNVKIHSEMPEFVDGFMVENGLVIIEGSVVVPKAKEVVTKFEL